MIGLPTSEGARAFNCEPYAYVVEQGWASSVHDCRVAVRQCAPLPPPPPPEPPEPPSLPPYPPGGAPPPGYLPVVLVHIMPWFDLRRQNSHWTAQRHEKDGYYLDDRYSALGRVAAHYTPMIGPYASVDRDTIRLHLELMRLAGIIGIVVNWYGVHNADYDFLAASDALVEEASAAGMLWTVCYEDRTIDPNADPAAQRSQLRADWESIRDRYVARFDGVLRDGRGGRRGRPLFLVFGPVVLLQRTTWSSMLDAVFPTASERPSLLGVDTGGYAASACPDGDYLWPGWALFADSASASAPPPPSVAAWVAAFYDKAASQGFYPLVGAAFPRFRDFYAEGSVTETPEAWWGQHVPDEEGATLATTLDAAAARGAHAVQLVTWNDWREGTAIEPSAEEGFAQLLRLQRRVRGFHDEAPMRRALRAYNALKAPTWRHCDNVPIADRLDCGQVGSNAETCAASGCCWRPTASPGKPWCFHRAATPVCTCSDALRNCSATPQDRLCCCTHNISAAR